MQRWYSVQALIEILKACAPVFAALVAIIPTVISNRKKTQASIKASNDATKEQLDEMQATLNNHIREDEDEKARTQRYRILRFYDEMCEGRKQSESHFEDILDDIDAYEKYCLLHPNFKNCRGHMAMQGIKEKYAEFKSDGGFLTHKEE